SGHAGPRQILRRVAEDDVALLPRHVEHLGRLSMHVERGVRSEVADPRLELEAAVRLDDEEAVEPDRAAGVRTDRHADATGFVALLLAADRRFLGVPAEHL